MKMTNKKQAKMDFRLENIVEKLANMNPEQKEEYLRRLEKKAKIWQAMSEDKGASIQKIESAKAKREIEESTEDRIMWCITALGLAAGCFLGDFVFGDKYASTMMGLAGGGFGAIATQVGTDLYKNMPITKGIRTARKKVLEGSQELLDTKATTMQDLIAYVRNNQNKTEEPEM